MAQHSPTSLPGNIPALDGLRGVAVLLVLGSHTSLPYANHEILPLGWIGVDLFFVLSGFLITRILLATRESPRFFSNFYARRILRIWPVYFVLLAFVFVLERLGIFHTQSSTVAWISLLIFAQNLYISGFGWNAIPDWLEPTWSLGIEEQFYLIWPLLVRKLSSRALKIFCLTTILMTPFVRAIAWNVFPWQDAATVLTFCRFDSLCFGTLLAIFSLEGQLAYGRRLLRFSLPAFIIFLAIERWASPFIDNVTRYSLLGAVFAALVALCATPIGPSTVRKLAISAFTFSPLRFVGKISYCLYLVHTAAFAIASSHPAQRILRHLAWYNPQGWSQVFINWVCAFLVATLSWYLFESPILRLKRRFEDTPATSRTALVASA